jgi:hypothetical protein
MKPLLDLEHLLTGGLLDQLVNRDRQYKQEAGGVAFVFAGANGNINASASMKSKYRFAAVICTLSCG